MGCLTETHLTTIVLETFRASSHKQPSISLCDRLITYCFPGLIVGNAMIFPRHLATHSRTTSHPRGPLIDIIRHLESGLSAHAGCRPPASRMAEMAATMFVDPHRLDLPRICPDGTAPARPSHARLSQGSPAINAQGIHAAMVAAENNYQSWAPWRQEQRRAQGGRILSRLSFTRLRVVDGGEPVSRLCL